MNALLELRLFDVIGIIMHWLANAFVWVLAWVIIIGIVVLALLILLALIGVMLRAVRSLFKRKEKVLLSETLSNECTNRRDL